MERRINMELKDASGFCYFCGFCSVLFDNSEVFEL